MPSMMIVKKLVRTLIDERGMTKEQVAAEVGASVRSVERWYKGRGKPLSVYRDKLQGIVDERSKVK